MEKRNIIYLIIVVILIISAIFIWKNNQEQVSSIEAKAIIGPEGGVIEIDDLSSKLYGFKLEIPEGALDEDVEIVVSISNIKEVKYQDVVNIGEVIKLEPEGLAFNKPISITVPYHYNNFTS